MMVKKELEQYCWTLISEAYKDVDTTHYFRNKKTKELLNEVWPWWKNLSVPKKQQIFREKANPATVYSVDKLMRKKREEFSKLPWCDRAWKRMLWKLRLSR